MARLDDFTEEEFSVAKETLSVSLMGNIPSKRNPFAVLTGGQPGSGKTTIYRIYADITYGDIVFINGDDFRKRHPNFLKYTRNMAVILQHTQMNFLIEWFKK